VLFACYFTVLAFFLAILFYYFKFYVLVSAMSTMSVLFTVRRSCPYSNGRLTNVHWY